ncbi:MAG: thymidylate synthase [Nitrososphaerales archaeon]|jgi:thymidylate synthase
MEIEQPGLVDAVKEAKRVLQTNGTLVERHVGGWCLQDEGFVKMREIRNVLITVDDPRNIWHNQVNRGLLLETLDILLGLNPGFVHKEWGFYNKWRTKNWKYPYTYGERIFSDQINQWNECVKILRAEPTSRQASIVIRRPEDLLVSFTPCSISLQFYVDDRRRLSTTWMMRSNDIAIGGLPRNIFIGCQLQMQMALATKLAVGKYHHFDVNLHHYTNKPKVLIELDKLKSEVNRHGNPPYLDDEAKSILRGFLESFFESGKVGDLRKYKGLEPYWKDWLNRIAQKKVP